MLSTMTSPVLSPSHVGVTSLSCASATAVVVEAWRGEAGPVGAGVHARHRSLAPVAAAAGHTYVLPQAVADLEGMSLGNGGVFAVKRGDQAQIATTPYQGVRFEPPV